MAAPAAKPKLTVEIERMIDAAARLQGRIAADRHELDGTQKSRFAKAFCETVYVAFAAYDNAPMICTEDAFVAYHTDFRTPRADVPPPKDPQDVEPMALIDQRLLWIVRELDWSLRMDYFRTRGVENLSLLELRRMRNTASLIDAFYPAKYVHAYEDKLTLAHYYTLLVAPARIARVTCKLTMSMLSQLRLMLPVLAKELEFRMGPIRDRLMYAHANVGGRMVQHMRKLRAHENGDEVRTIQQRVLSFLYQGDTLQPSVTREPTQEPAAADPIARAQLVRASTCVIKAEQAVPPAPSCNKRQRIA